MINARIICAENEHVPDRFQIWLADAIHIAGASGVTPKDYVWDVQVTSPWRRHWELGLTPTGALAVEFGLPKGGDQFLFNKDKAFGPNGAGDVAFRRGQRFSTDSMPLGFSFCNFRRDSHDRAYWIAAYACEFFRDDVDSGLLKPDFWRDSQQLMV